MSNSFRGNNNNDTHADFDEATANHFPSPRTGDFVKGASPGRWSGGSSASSIGMFSFHEHPPSVGGHSIDDIVNAAGMFQHQQEQHEQEQEESFSKKMKKTKRVDPNKRESNESGISEISAISGLTALSDNLNLINGIYNVEISPRGENLLESPYLFDVGVNTGFDGFYNGYDETIREVAMRSPRDLMMTDEPSNTHLFPMPRLRRAAKVTQSTSTLPHEPS